MRLNPPRGRRTSRETRPWGTTLKLLGVETRFVRFPEENHELSRADKPSRRVQRFEEQLAWFDRFVKQRKAGG